MVTFEDITKENYCEYQTLPSGKWFPSKFAASVVIILILIAALTSRREKIFLL
jgi:hypothetical protein